MRASCSVILPSAFVSELQAAVLKGVFSESFSLRCVWMMSWLVNVVVLSLRWRDSGDLVKPS